MQEHVYFNTIFVFYSVIRQNRLNQFSQQCWNILSKLCDGALLLSGGSTAKISRTRGLTLSCIFLAPIEFSLSCSYWVFLQQRGFVTNWHAISSTKLYLTTKLPTGNKIARTYVWLSKFHLIFLLVALVQTTSSRQQWPSRLSSPGNSDWLRQEINKKEGLWGS